MTAFFVGGEMSKMDESHPAGTLWTRARSRSFTRSVSLKQQRTTADTTTAADYQQQRHHHQRDHYNESSSAQVFSPTFSTIANATHLPPKKSRPATVADLQPARRSSSLISRVDHRNISSSMRRPLQFINTGRSRSISDKVLNLSHTQRKQIILGNNKKKDSVMTTTANDSDNNKRSLSPLRTSGAAAGLSSSKGLTRADSVFAGRVTASSVMFSKSKSSSTSKTNKICLHVYDLISKDALMLLPPFGCIVEIGQCFANMNSALHELGTGAYHVGVEVNGLEYAFGASSQPGRTGVFTCYPTMSPGYQFRSTIDLGDRPKTKRKVRTTRSSATNPSGGVGGKSTVIIEEERTIEATVILKEMAREYLGTDYDILRKNCCSFACDVCIRLGVPEEEIPSWFRNLAESGAATRDMALATVQPIASVLSTFESNSGGGIDAENYYHGRKTTTSAAACHGNYSLERICH